MHALIAEGLRTRFYAAAPVRERLAAVERAVAEGRQPALAAAMEMLRLGAAGRG
jgi:LAO/AO transport system kinase